MIDGKTNKNDSEKEFLNENKCIFVLILFYFFAPLTAFTCSPYSWFIFNNLPYRVVFAMLIVTDNGSNIVKAIKLLNARAIQDKQEAAASREAEASEFDRGANDDAIVDSSDEDELIDSNDDDNSLNWQWHWAWWSW